MYIKLISVKEECGSCPTTYSGETVDGKYLEASLRNGYMKIELNDRTIVSVTPRGLDGTCSFSDFKEYAKRYGYVIDDSDAKFSSRINEIEDAIEEAFRGKVWVEFTETMVTKTERFEKGKRYIATQKVADKLVALDCAKIV